MARDKRSAKASFRSNDALRHARLEDKGWTKEELARKADVSAQTVRKAERDQPISETSMARLSKALGVPMKKLFPDS